MSQQNSSKEYRTVFDDGTCTRGFSLRLCVGTTFDTTQRIRTRENAQPQIAVDISGTRKQLCPWGFRAFKRGCCSDYVSALWPGYMN